MFTISNLLTLARFPLAFLFLIQSAPVRIVAVLLATFSDMMDGYIARRTNQISIIGTILDPVMDRFFVYFALLILFLESKLNLWQVGLFASRDLFLFLYGIHFIFSKKPILFHIKPLIWGKVFTSSQLVFLFFLSSNYQLRG